MPREGGVVDEQAMKGIGRQIKLPWSKAVEIAAKSMKVRMGRSVVTTASIVLAIAFLMSILTGTTLTTSLRTRPQQEVLRVREQLEQVEAGAIAPFAFPDGLSEDQLSREISSKRKRAEEDETDPLVIQRLFDEVAVAEAARQVLRADTDYQRARAMRDWQVSNARLELTNIENEWQRLVRRLRLEGVTGLSVEVTRAPPERGYFRMLAEEMEPRDRWLGVVAVMVCFVGIWNAMLMSVHERIREIGTMKCLGALEAFIIKLYFLESSFIGMTGTFMGILIGFVLSFVRASWAFGFGPLYSYFDFGGALLSAVFTLLIGSALSVLAAVFPAYRAAKYDPVVAMRVEE